MKLDLSKQRCYIQNRAQLYVLRLFFQFSQPEIKQLFALITPKNTAVKLLLTNN